MSSIDCNKILSLSYLNNHTKAQEHNQYNRRSRQLRLLILFVEAQGSLLFDLLKWASCFQHPQLMYIHDHLAVNIRSHLLRWQHACSQNSVPVYTASANKVDWQPRILKCSLLFCLKWCHINIRMISYLHTTCSFSLGRKYQWIRPIVNSWRNNTGHQWDITMHCMLSCFWKGQFGFKKHK